MITKAFRNPWMWARATGLNGNIGLAKAHKFSHFRVIRLILDIRVDPIYAPVFYFYPVDLLAESESIAVIEASTECLESKAIIVCPSRHIENSLK